MGGGFAPNDAVVRCTCALPRMRGAAGRCGGHWCPSTLVPVLLLVLLCRLFADKCQMITIVFLIVTLLVLLIINVLI
jgi:hypothetical protein